MSRGNLLQPLANTASTVFTVTAGALVVGTVARLYAVVTQPVCFTAKNWPYGGDDQGVSPGTTLDGVRDVWLCVPQPAVWQRAFSFVADVIGPYAYAAALLVLLLVLKRAAHEGVHTFATATRLRGLGHFVLWVIPGAMLVESIARTTLVHSGVTYDPGALVAFGEWEIPWWAIVTGAGLLSLSKIMRDSAEMRADLEGTV